MIFCNYFTKKTNKTQQRVIDITEKLIGLHSHSGTFALGMGVL